MGSEVVIYVPAAGHPATAGIARGSAIVAQPDAKRQEVRVYYEGAVYGQSEMRTLADRAVYACGRMVDNYPTAAATLVPRDALAAVGTFDPSTSEIVLTGDQSAAAVAEWLDMPQLDPAELRRGLEHPLTVRKLADPEIKVVVSGDLALALIRRSGLRREEGEWISPDGRRTAAISEAVLWALLRIAAGAAE
jgi:hypothetical protein